MYIGVDYYPEHWPKARWKTDAKLMKEAGFNVVRLAEFAWVKMEPEEGKFDFAWLDEALVNLKKQGISAILGTPTAIMPAWMARKYPEAMATQSDGVRITWGVRKNNCFNSGAYRLLSERVITAMARHYAGNPAVIGWQTDNEFGGPICFCVNCLGNWQDWLRSKYKTLDELNRAWGTHFWASRYQTWGEIPMPTDMHAFNPSQCLDWKRFQSHLNVSFQHSQVEILRRECPGHFVTHNLMGLFSELNYYDLAKDLDHVSWDNYPVWGKPEIPYESSAAADVMRGLKRKNFWIMEQTAGPHGWGTFARNPRPGEIRKMVFQQMAHGADGMLWFRWRSCTVGREQYWHGLLGHDGKALRRYQEAARTARDFHKLGKDLQGTTVKAEVAMIYDYESIWAFDIQPAYGSGNFFGANQAANRYQEAMKRYYRAFFRAGINVDMVRPGQDLSGYKLVLAPHQYLMPDALAQQLNEYVRKGGVLLADCRTGVKDETSLCHERTLPGLLSKALGVKIEEYEGMGEDMNYAVAGGRGFSGAFTAVQYADWMTAEKADSLAGYKDWHMKKFSALTRNKYGRGTGYYVGTIFKEDAFYDQLAAELLKTAKITALAVPPAGVEASVREGKAAKLLFLVNHTEEIKTVKVPENRTELVSGKKTGKTWELGAYGVAVIKV